MTKGHVSATDYEIIAAYQRGWFIHQICTHMHVGINRVRSVIRENSLKEEMAA